MNSEFTLTRVLSLVLALTITTVTTPKAHAVKYVGENWLVFQNNVDVINSRLDELITEVSLTHTQQHSAGTSRNLQFTRFFNEYHNNMQGTLLIPREQYAYFLVAHISKIIHLSITASRRETAALPSYRTSAYKTDHELTAIKTSTYTLAERLTDLDIVTLVQFTQHLLADLAQQHYHRTVYKLEIPVGSALLLTSVFSLFGVVFASFIPTVDADTFASLFVAGVTIPTVTLGLTKSLGVVLRKKRDMSSSATTDHFTSQLRTLLGNKAEPLIEAIRTGDTSAICQRALTPASATQQVRVAVSTQLETQVDNEEYLVHETSSTTKQEEL